MPANMNAMTRYNILNDLLSSRYHIYLIDDFLQKRNTAAAGTILDRLCTQVCASN